MKVLTYKIGLIVRGLNSTYIMNITTEQVGKDYNDCINNLCEKMKSNGLKVICITECSLICNIIDGQKICENFKW